MSEFARSIDPRFYDQPGFPELENAWCRVFEVRNPEGYVMDAEEALELLDNTRMSVAFDYGYTQSELDILESIASRYARESSWLLQEEMEDLTRG